MASDDSLMEELQSLQKKLGKKSSFEEAVSSLQSLVLDRYSSSSPSLRRSMYCTVCRVATILQTRYKATGFWLAGLRLFEQVQGLVSESSEKEHLKKCIARAREHLNEMENAVLVSSRQPGGRFLFEGHLTVGPEVAQNLLTTLTVARDSASVSESSRGQEENNITIESFAFSLVPESARELLNSVEGMNAFHDLENAIEASLREIGAQPPQPQPQPQPQRPPPASKEVVANLPIINVTEEVIARLGSETVCAVYRENLVINDKMQELPCKHLFHSSCLKPWLDEHNSCPICRHELRTDDHRYEIWKEREKEAGEERRAAANACRGGEFMYI